MYRSSTTSRRPKPTAFRIALFALAFSTQFVAPSQGRAHDVVIVTEAPLQYDAGYDRSLEDKRALRRTRIGTSGGVLLGFLGAGTMLTSSVAANLCWYDCPGRSHTPGTRAGLLVGSAALAGGIAAIVVTTKRRRAIKRRTEHLHSQGNENPSRREWHAVTPPPALAGIKF